MTSTLMNPEHRASLELLISRGESGRVQRADTRPMANEPEWTAGRWVGECAGQEKRTQRPVIRLEGRRSFNCTCTDKARKGRTLGPCKHVISLARKALGVMDEIAACPF